MSSPHQSKTHEPEVIGYCVHCRSRRTMQGATQVCNRRGKHDLKGHCSVCGKGMYRLGGWNTVSGAKPEEVPTIAPHSETSV
ncbi:MAG: hypothetical protein H7308_14840 [Chthonomonadaceae bacterium]|nr:hypothetical protein [Chthonomonadaceae bacterium]